MSGPLLDQATRKKGEKAVQNIRLERLAVEYADVDSIKPNSYNPNRQDERDFELLQRSIREDGFTQPVVVQKATREIVDGEHRWRAARSLGMRTVPIVLVEMSAEQMKVATLRHNRARGSEDVELGAELLRDLRKLGALEWAKDSLMLSDADIERLISDVPVAEQLASDNYGEAWAPTKATVNDVHKPGITESMSDEARAQAAEFRSAMTQAPSDQARQALEASYRDKSLKMQVTYTEADADLVRRVLEPKPAAKIYELCLAEQARREADFDA
jgi:ParB/RepB/Spo0J family partition protein